MRFMKVLIAVVVQVIGMAILRDRNAWSSTSGHCTRNANGTRNLWLGVVLIVSTLLLLAHTMAISVAVLECRAILADF